MHKRIIYFHSILLSLILVWADFVGAQDIYYKGKTLRIIVGTSAGGGFDTYTRTIARHLGKHIPGQPAIVVENMPGAGHLIGANHMYNVAKPDGLTIGHFHGGWFLYQLFKRSGIEFDAT
ncbi:MAG: family tricarboxylate transporter, receptor protein, partial [Deltaproteobacteria bacterium]|nr:family tricarboxylate transporter, receptor protein [Deltaproteobacteria bacterium]